MVVVSNHKLGAGILRNGEVIEAFTVGQTEKALFQ